jgi:DNA-binding transcriptional ArsR family regulator
MTYGTALAALADPTRRAMYERLRRRSHTVGELARQLHVTQPAVSQHLKVLREARLVTHEAEGTRRHYRATPEGLEALRRYLESLWDDVLEAYAAADPHPPAQRRKP